MKKRFWIIGILVVLVAAGIFAYRTKAKNQTAAEQSIQTGTVTVGTVESTISGVGSVRARQSATINWQTSGKVNNVNAQIGQQVQAGDVLASLDPGSVSTNIIQAQADLITAKQSLADLQKPQPLKIAQAQQALTTAQDALDKLMNPTDADIAAAELAVANAQDALTKQQGIVDKMGFVRGSQDQITLAQADYLMAQDRVKQLQNMYDKTRGDPTMDGRKALALSNLQAAETARDKALANLNWYSGYASAADIADANNTLAVDKQTLANAQDTLAKLKNPTQEDIALAQATVADAQQTLTDAQNGATADDLAVAQTKITLAQATIDQTSLKAPFSGTITGINVQPGDLVSQGTEAFQMANTTSMLVDLSISEVDIHSVKVGQDAIVEFDAISGKQYNAKVTQVELAPTISNGVVNYPVTVEISDADAQIYPGMTAAVTIVTQKSENVLTVPSSAIHTSAGQKSVTVLFEGQQISVPVTVGLVGASSSEVSSTQLREGDTVVLSGTSGTTTSSTGQTFRQNFGGGGAVFGGGPGGIP